MTDSNQLLNYYFERNKKYQKYKVKLFKTLEILRDLENTDEKILIIKDLYAYIKNISIEFYVEEKNEFVCLQNLVEIITYCEETLEKEYIIDIKTNFEQQILHNMEKIIEIVYLTRSHLLNRLTMGGRYHHPFDFYNLEDYCEIACDYMESICEDLHIKCQKYKLLYGFNNNLSLFKGCGFHCFNVLEINGNYYLVDCTYKQFFLLKKCLLERIGIPYLSGCYPGVFMCMTEKRKNIAEQIIQNGYLPLTDDTFKNYMDGFLLSWRNGLYYEETKDYSYTTPYTAEDYWNFLKNKDNILHYEKDYTLGFQNKPNKQK